MLKIPSVPHGAAQSSLKAGLEAGIKAGKHMAGLVAAGAAFNAGAIAVSKALDDGNKEAPQPRTLNVDPRLAGLPSRGGVPGAFEQV